MVWRYAALLIGVVGTLLASFSGVGMVLSWPMAASLPDGSFALFVLAGVSGIGQWWMFWQRRFRSALVMFAFTIAAWSGAAWWHMAAVSNCIGTRCVLVIHVKQA